MVILIEISQYFVEIQQYICSFLLSIGDFASSRSWILRKYTKKGTFADKIFIEITL